MPNFEKKYSVDDMLEAFYKGRLAMLDEIHDKELSPLLFNKWIETYISKSI